MLSNLFEDPTRAILGQKSITSSGQKLPVMSAIWASGSTGWESVLNCWRQHTNKLTRARVRARGNGLVPAAFIRRLKAVVMAAFSLFNSAWQKEAYMGFMNVPGPRICSVIGSPQQLSSFLPSKGEMILYQETHLTLVLFLFVRIHWISRTASDPRAVDL